MNARNKPLIDVAAKVERVQKREACEEKVDIFSDEMGKASRGVALMLGCCPECWEDMKVVDGRWVCLACEANNESMRGGYDGSGTGD